MARQRSLASISSRQRYGTAPREMPKITRSKSRPWVSVRTATSGDGAQNDSTFFPRTRSASRTCASAARPASTAGLHVLERLVVDVRIHELHLARHVDR